MDDTISRKAVIDGPWKLEIETRPSWFEAVIKMVGELSSAQPRRCVDCENFNMTQMIIPQPNHRDFKQTPRRKDMSKEEAINFLRKVQQVLLESNSWFESTHELIKETFDMAIEALEREKAEQSDE